MAKKKKPVDKVRASRDGHEFHEIWTARRAMQLLLPGNRLTAIAIEGLSPRDQANASSSTVEIADLTLYYGEADFDRASRITISQFKYSIAKGDAELRVTDVKETIAKFAESYRSIRRKHGVDTVRQKLDFELVTNRPIFAPFQDAIDSLKSGAAGSAAAQNQAKQFSHAAGLKGKALAEFAGKITLNGTSGSLAAGKRSLARLVVDWSATDDLIASSRLGKVKDFIREKAGHAGSYKNLIKRTDMLAELGIEDAEDLLPCKSALPVVEKVVERDQLSAAIALIPTLRTPLLVHATGGVGKTVFMESLAARITGESETVFFDCFGGGAYRSPSDARHLPKKGLIHIANTLAIRGLCDPILPGATDTEALLTTFRRRLTQCVATLKTQAAGRNLVIFIDAIDNAQLFADERQQEAFPTLLLASLRYQPIDGVKLVVSCRPERKPKSLTGYEDFSLRPFTLQETETYLKGRLKGVSAGEIQVAQARSGGNARVLEYLVTSDRGLLDKSEVEKKIELEDLIQQRITAALGIAIERGYQQTDIDAFLAGLATLPPPVPLDEYANAHGMKLDEIESFASDLNPLLERTNQGLMFRDEPTETLVRKRYSSLKKALQRVAENLQSRQDSSVYAARALPALLQQLDDGDQLFKLALDDRIPSTIKSTVGKRNIRYSRIKAAVRYAANKQDYNKLVRLLVELSTVASVDERGANYILEYPDLVVAANDADSMRRLFETRTSWPGARHARLAIANALSGDSGEAYRHARAASEWLDHHRRSYNPKNDLTNRVKPERLDIAAIPFFLVCRGRVVDAKRMLEGWRAWYSFEVSEYLFDCLRLAASLKRASGRKVSAFLDELSETGALAAALSFGELGKGSEKALITKLVRACRTEKDFTSGSFYHKERTYDLSDGIRRGCIRAVLNGQSKEAKELCLRIPYSQPTVWFFRDNAFRSDLFPFAFRVALLSAINGKAIKEADLLPKDLMLVLATIKQGLSSSDFTEEARRLLKEAPTKDRDGKEPSKDPRAMSYDEKRDAEGFLVRKLPLFLSMTKALGKTLVASKRAVDVAFLELINAWEIARKHKDSYRESEFDNLFRMLGLEMALFVLWVRPELSKSSVERLLKTLHSQNASTTTLIQLVAILAKRQPLHELAGEQAVKARGQIETENDVAQKASHFASLARAILPASQNEAATYFHAGLEKMDAIGSGDYVFTNDLLLFASTLKGGELPEEHFHTLSNIAELNLGEEPEKFFWIAYARGMSKASGARGLAKLSRWDDRTRVGLHYTLYPYLILLVGDGKLESDLALALNRLAEPAEYYEFGTKEFIAALQARGATTRTEIVAELVNQYLDDNPGISSDSTVAVLAPLAASVLGEEAEVTKYLRAGEKEFGEIRAKQSAQQNFHGNERDIVPGARVNDRDRENRKILKLLSREANPADESSLARALKKLAELEHVWDLRGGFFDAVRKKVEFSSRGQYIKIVATSEHLNWFWKFAELEECKRLWSSSSSSIDAALASTADSLLGLHADAIVEDGRFSGYKVKELSDLTGVSQSDLVLNLIKALSQPDAVAGGAAWLGMACSIAPKADAGMGQLALERLLASESAGLANGVADGKWLAGLYPEDDTRIVASGLIWRQLGSPHAEDRWRAAHAVRTLGRLNRWDVIDRIVAVSSSKTAGSFQARELVFYYLHARLWLFIALARLALEHPTEVARYRDTLFGAVIEAAEPHVLLRHFARKALLFCLDAGALTLESGKEERLRSADQSPHPRLEAKTKGRSGAYHGRPKGTPKPDFEFHLDMDFNKSDVDNLSQVFGKGTWEVSDLISSIVKGLDPSIESMYDAKGRQSRFSRESYGMSDRYHSYGQYVGWHSLFYAAAKLLKDYPVTNDWWDSGEADPWANWLRRYTLSRKDGLWLSDGTDRIPIDSQRFLLLQGRKHLKLTGDEEVIKSLVGVGTNSQEIVVEGDWHSADGVKISISSALVDPKDAQSLAQKLLDDEPVLTWLPTFSGSREEPEYSSNTKEGYEPWVLNPSGDSRLDKLDPLGVDEANHRSSLASLYSTSLGIESADAFGRVWSQGDSSIVLRAQAWGRNESERERGPHPGLRLLGKSSALGEILSKHNKTLLILVVLRRSEQETYQGSSKWTHTVAAISITKKLKITYHPGRINFLHKTKW